MMDSQSAQVAMENPMELCCMVTAYNYWRAKPGGDIGMKPGCNGSCVPIPNHPRFYPMTKYAYTDYNTPNPNACKMSRRGNGMMLSKLEARMVVYDIPYVFSIPQATMNTIARNQPHDPPIVSTLQRISQP